MLSNWFRSQLIVAIQSYDICKLKVHVQFSATKGQKYRVKEIFGRPAFKIGLTAHVKGQTKASIPISHK